jgi:hypothetical protein
MKTINKLIESKELTIKESLKAIKRTKNDKIIEAKIELINNCKKQINQLRNY